MHPFLRHLEKTNSVLILWFNNVHPKLLFSMQFPESIDFKRTPLRNPMCDIVHSSMGLKIKTHTSNNANLDWRKLRKSGYKQWLLEYIE